jgi:hypothetical protein
MLEKEIGYSVMVRVSKVERVCSNLREKETLDAQSVENSERKVGYFERVYMFSKGDVSPSGEAEGDGGIGRDLGHVIGVLRRVDDDGDLVGDVCDGGAMEAWDTQ